MEGLCDPLIHMDHHALVLADGVVALLDALADPVQERRADDLWVYQLRSTYGGANIADPWLWNLQQLFAIRQEVQNLGVLLEEGVDDLQREVLVRWDVHLLDGVHRDV